MTTETPKYFSAAKKLSWYKQRVELEMSLTYTTVCHPYYPIFFLCHDVKNCFYAGRRCYDATESMENAFEAPLDRLRCLRGLHNCGLLRVGNKDTGT